MPPLVNVPASSEHVLYVFYVFENTQPTKHLDRANEHLANLVYLQQFCSKCEIISDIEQVCIQCWKLIHSFWDEPVGNVLGYLCEFRSWVEKIIVIAHNANAFDLHFIPKRDIFPKWQVELIMNAMKIMCMWVESLVFLDSVSFLPFALRNLPEAFGLTVAKSWYTLYFNTRANLDYIGKIPDISYYGVDEMSAIERNEFLAWYEDQKDDFIDNRRVLE